MHPGGQQDVSSVRSGSDAFGSSPFRVEAAAVSEVNTHRQEDGLARIVSKRQQQQQPPPPQQLPRHQHRSPPQADGAGTQSQRSDDSFSAYLHQPQSSSPASSQHKEQRTNSRELSSPLVAPRDASVLQTPVASHVERDHARPALHGPEQHQLHTPSHSMADPWRREQEVSNASRPLVSYENDDDDAPHGWGAVLAARKTSQKTPTLESDPRHASPPIPSEHGDNWEEVKEDEDELVDDDDDLSQEAGQEHAGDTSTSFATSGIDVDDSIAGGKKRRRRMNKQETSQLASVFAQTQFPDADTRQQLAAKLNMSVRSVSIWFQNKRQAVKKRASRFGGVEGIRGATVVAKRYESEEPELRDFSSFRRWPSLDDFAGKSNPDTDSHREGSQSPCASPQREVPSRPLPLLDAFQARTGHKLSRIASMPAMAKLVGSHFCADGAASGPGQSPEAVTSTPRKDLRDFIFGRPGSGNSASLQRSMGLHHRPTLHRSASASVLRPVANQPLMEACEDSSVSRRVNGRPRTNSEVALRTGSDGQATLLIDAEPVMADAKEAPLAGATSAVDKRLARLRMPSSLAEALRRHGLTSISLGDKADEDQAKRKEATMWQRMESSSSSAMSGSDGVHNEEDNLGRTEARAPRVDEEDEETTLRIIANRRAAKLKAKMEQHQGSKESWITDARVALGLAKPCRQDQRNVLKQRSRKMVLPPFRKSASQSRGHRSMDNSLIQSSHLPTLDMAANRDRALARSPSWGSVVESRLTERKAIPSKAQDRKTNRYQHVRAASSPQQHALQNARLDGKQQKDAGKARLYGIPDDRRHAMGALSGNSLARSTSLSRMNEQQALRLAGTYTRSLSSTASLYQPQQAPSSERRPGALGAPRPSSFLYPGRSEIFHSTPPLSMRYSHSRGDANANAATAPLGFARSQSSVFGVLRNSYANSQPSRFGALPAHTTAQEPRFGLAADDAEVEDAENIPSLNSSQRSDGSDDWTDRWTAERSPDKAAPLSSLTTGRTSLGAGQLAVAGHSPGKHDDSGFFGSDEEDEGNLRRSFNSKKRLSSPSSTSSPPLFATSSPGKKRKNETNSSDRKALGSATSRINSAKSSPSKAAHHSSDRDRLAAEMLLDLGSQSQS